MVAVKPVSLVESGTGKTGRALFLTIYDEFAVDLLNLGFSPQYLLRMGQRVKRKTSKAARDHFAGEASSWGSSLSEVIRPRRITREGVFRKLKRRGMDWGVPLHAACARSYVLHTCMYVFSSEPEPPGAQRQHEGTTDLVRAGMSHRPRRPRNHVRRGVPPRGTQPGSCAPPLRGRAGAAGRRSRAALH